MSAIWTGAISFGLVRDLIATCCNCNDREEIAKKVKA